MSRNYDSKFCWCLPKSGGSITHFAIIPIKILGFRRSLEVLEGFPKNNVRIISNTKFVLCYTNFWDLTYFADALST